MILTCGPHSTHPNHETVKLLLNAGANVNLQNQRFKDTALTIISHGGIENQINIYRNKSYLDTMRLLIRAGADIDHQNDFGSALVNASSIGGDIKMVKLLIGEGASVNLQSNGRTALMQALSYRHLDIVKVLLSSGATEGINLQDSGGFSALMIASDKGHREAVKLLLSAGADTELKNWKEKTALKASKKGIHDLVRSSGICRMCSIRRVLEEQSTDEEF